MHEVAPQISITEEQLRLKAKTEQYRAFLYKVRPELTEGTYPLLCSTIASWNDGTNLTFLQIAERLENAGK